MLERTALLRRLDHSAPESETERARSRHRRVVVAAAAGIGSRALTALALLITLPLAQQNLDSQELGVWVLLVSAVALLGFADLGASNGLVNVLSGAVGADDHDAARQAVTSTWFGLVAIATTGAVIATVATLVIPWNDVLNVQGTTAAELRPAVATFAAMILVTIPAGIGQRIHIAYQQGWAAAATNGAGSVLSILGVAIAAWCGAGLAWFVAAMLAGNALAFAGESLWVFYRSHPDLRPTRSSFHPATLRRVLRTGGLFFVLALAGAIAYQSDTLVISNHLGSEEVPRYVVGLRLFLLVPSAVAAVVTPLWPAYGEAIARNDSAWVRRTLRRSLAATVAMTLASSVALLVVAGPILRRWAGGVAAPSAGLLLAMGAWAVVSATSTTLAMYLNGANIVRFQVVVAIGMAVSNLALSIVLVRGIGIVGPLWASVVTQTVVVLIPELIVVRRLLRRTEQQHEQPQPQALAGVARP